MKTLKWNGLIINVGDWIWINNTTEKYFGDKYYGGITKIKNIRKSPNFNLFLNKNQDNGDYILILNDSKVNNGDWYLYKSDIKKEVFVIAKTKKELLSQVTAKIL